MADKMSLRMVIEYDNVKKSFRVEQTIGQNVQHYFASIGNGDLKKLVRKIEQFVSALWMIAERND